MMCYQKKLTPLLAMHRCDLQHYLLAMAITSTLLLFGCGKPPLRLGVTTTLEDSGLLSRLTTDFYHDHGITITPIVAGSGQLFSLIERGDVDLAITHEPMGEKQLVEKGVVLSRQALFYNYFVIVGNKNDPANIQYADSTSDVFFRIMTSNSLYISRNDNSGTHRMEQYWWLHAQETLTKTLPKKSSRSSSSYVLSTGTGMGNTLTVTANKNAYTLVDIGTWLAFENKQELRILWRDNNTLRNDYHLLTLDPKRITPPDRTQKESHIFATWVHTWAQTVLSKNQPIKNSTKQTPLNALPFYTAHMTEQTPTETPP